MGLQPNQNHVKGTDRKFFLVKETTPGTFVKAATGHSANCEEFNIDPSIERKDRTDSYMASRDVLERITGKSSYSWNYKGMWVPSGTKNVAPDLGDLLLAALGTETVNANDVTYATNSSQQLTTLSMTQHFIESFQESLAGGLVEELKMVFAGGEEPRIEASGIAMTYAATGYSTLNMPGGLTTPWTTMVVQTVDKNGFATNASAVGGAGAGARSIIQINDGSSPATNVEVTVDSSAPSFTITSATNDHDDAAAVTPWVPTHTVASASPVSGINGTFTHAAFSAVLTGFEFTLKNNIKAFNDEAFTQHLRDGIPNMREITGNLNFRIRRDHLIHILNRKDFATVAIACAVGGAAQSGTRLEIDMPQVEVGWSAVQVPQVEEATISLPFKALGASGNDAITLKHT